MESAPSPEPAAAVDRAPSAPASPSLAGHGVAADPEVQDRLVGPVDELSGGDPGAAHELDDVGVGELLDVVDALLGQSGAVVEVDPLEVGQRRRFVEGQMLQTPSSCDSFSRSHTSALCGMKPTKNISTSAAGPS